MLGRTGMLLVVSWVTGCAGVAAMKEASAPAAAPEAPQPQAGLADSSASGPSDEAARVETATLSAEAAPAAPASAPAVPPAGAMPAASPMELPRPNVPKRDIEAHLTLQVKDVATTIERLRRLTAESAGEVVAESVEDGAASPRGRLTLRVASKAADDFLRRLEAVGSVVSRQVTAKDVGKEYYDASLRLQNLERALARYEQILARANQVDEILRVEEQIARLRGQIEQIKGELRYLQDRVARATIYVTLVGPEVAPEPPIINPMAKFFPGLRLGYLADFRDDGASGHLGGGLSLRFVDRVSIDVEGFREIGSEEPGLDLLLVTLGADLYSEFLGGGQRRWFNPYFGVRAGYARFIGENALAVGGSAGVVIYRSELASVELDGRVYGMFGGSGGSHVAVQPTLGANVAF